MMRCLTICAFLALAPWGQAAAQAPESSGIPATEDLGPRPEPPPQTHPAPPSPTPQPSATQPPASQSPTARAAAPTSARAAALIAGSGASEFFEPADSPNQISVRHRASGLLCALNPNARLALVIYPPGAANVARGEDVSCNAVAANGALSLFATRYPTDISLDDAFTRSLDEFKAVHPNAQRYTPQVQIDLSDRPSLPRSRTATFLLRGASGNVFAGLWMAKVNGWIIKMRYNGPQGMQSELSSSVTWSTALSSASARR